jgi:hypothetical protein
LIQRKAREFDSGRLVSTGEAMTNTSKPFHQMIWIDHQVARVFGVMRDGLTELAVIHAPNEGRGHIHHKAGTMGPGHVDLPQSFLREAATHSRKRKRF